MLRNKLRWCVTAALVAMIAAPQPLLACAACFGRSESNLARGMNWGIFSLLAVVVFVLGCIAAFFVYLAKRAAATSRVIDQTAVASQGLEYSLAANRGPGTIQTALSNDKLI